MRNLWISFAIVALSSTFTEAIGSCPAEYLPHPTDCTKFYHCSNGINYEKQCPSSLYFNVEINVCDWPRNVKCEKMCAPLTNNNGYWTPKSCSSDPSKIGASCSLICDSKFELQGSAITQCTSNGWNSTNGNFIPRCVPSDCIGDDLEGQLNDTLSVDAGILFVLDESGSVSYADFLKTKEFVKNITAKFTLSPNRSAGVITFSSDAIVRIPITTSNTTDFMTAVDNINYRSGGTDLLAALELAKIEIGKNPHPLSLVFVITDGDSQTDATPAADAIKATKNPIFCIGVCQTKLLHLEQLSSGNANGIKHFFHVRDYEVLKSIGLYINRPPSTGGSNGNAQCP